MDKINLQFHNLNLNSSQTSTSKDNIINETRGENHFDIHKLEENFENNLEEQFHNLTFQKIPKIKKLML